MRSEREDKPAWSVVPARLKAAVARQLGSPVVRAARTYGGYGPSATYRLKLADGKRAFFKGTYPLPDGSGVVWDLDREERVYRQLNGVIRPWAPQYLGSVRADDWHGLLLETIGGSLLVPWTPTKARLAAGSYADFHMSTLSRPMPPWLSRTRHRDYAGFWAGIAAEEAALHRLAALAGSQSGDALLWLKRQVKTLRRWERALWRAPEPYSLLHFDTRSDNLRLDGTLLRIFDWPDASLGPAEFDVAAFVQSIEAEGGPACETVVGWYESHLPLRREVLTGSVVSIAGYFADRAPRPAVPGLPRLRSVQRRQLKASLSWAARLLDLAPPAWLAMVLD